MFVQSRQSINDEWRWDLVTGEHAKGRGVHRLPILSFLAGGGLYYCCSNKPPTYKKTFEKKTQKQWVMNNSIAY